MKIVHGYVTNHDGLTSRLAVELVNLANKFQSNIYFTVSDEKADLKSIMNVVAIIVPHGQNFTIEINGKDEESAYKKFTNLLQELKLTA